MLTNNPLASARRDLDQARTSLTAYLFAGNTPLSGRGAGNGSKFSKKIGTRRHRNLSAAISNAEARIRALASKQPDQVAA